ncbi:MAG: hypothetical protein FGM36_05265 [Burkholderiaceae bacterium]|nr:hypothetical protein [Burkholderiaceae bacterium]
MGKWEVRLWKSPQCGCCNDWIRYLEPGGSRIVVHVVGNVTTCASLGLPRRYGSCHTATVGGHVLEGPSTFA